MSSCLASNLAVFLEKYPSLSPAGVLGEGRLYGPEWVLCDTLLRHRLNPLSPVLPQLAFQQVLQHAHRSGMLKRGNLYLLPF